MFLMRCLQVAVNHRSILRVSRPLIRKLRPAAILAEMCYHLHLLNFRAALIISTATAGTTYARSESTHFDAMKNTEQQKIHYVHRGRLVDCRLQEIGRGVVSVVSSCALLSDQNKIILKM